MLIQINDRLCNEFLAWAVANNMNDNDIHKYIEDAFREKFTIDKYGDLNEKMKKSEPIETPKKIRKKADPKPIEPINEPISEPIDEPLSEEKPKRKTKVIASK